MFNMLGLLIMKLSNMEGIVARSVQMFGLPSLPKVAHNTTLDVA